MLINVFTELDSLLINFSPVQHSNKLKLLGTAYCNVPMKCTGFEKSAATTSCMVVCVISSCWHMASPNSSFTCVDYSPFEAVDIYKIMKWKLLMKRDEAGELLGICEM